MSRLIDLAGQRFGRLVVVSRAGSGKDRSIKWLCRCDCGGSSEAFGSNLRRGHTQSCGCFKGEAHIKHGLSGTPEYKAWHGMVKRCYDSSHKRYHQYGGRGIAVCAQWLISVDNFLSDMGKRPEGLSLDRMDNEGNYEPSNCRWATAQEQNSNRRCCISYYKDDRLL